MDIDDKLGHRGRIKERLLNSSPGQLADYEILEILLCMSQPRKDMKPLAKQLIREFGNLAHVLCAKMDDLKQISGIGMSILSGFRVVHEAASRLIKDSFVNNPILQSWDGLINYCKATMSHLNIEQFRVVYLDQKNMVIADIVQNEGTIDHVNIYPREIIKKALYLDASSIILVHNHPSGHLKPSKEDIGLTKEVIKACNAVNISVHDHIIISEKGYYSLKENKLI
jgi:DNA repair protein RadC